MTPPNIQVLLDTSPIEAEAFAPNAPTIEESIYCMAIVVICVRIAGRLSFHTSRICGFNSASISFFIRFPLSHKTYISEDARRLRMSMYIDAITHRQRSQ